MGGIVVAGGSANDVIHAYSSVSSASVNGNDGDDVLNVSSDTGSLVHGGLGAGILTVNGENDVAAYGDDGDERITVGYSIDSAPPAVPATTSSSCPSAARAGAFSSAGPATTALPATKPRIA